MNDPNAFGYQGTKMAEVTPPQPQPGPVNPMGQYKFSPDELRVLSECNRESFYQRSLPFATFFGFGTFVATQQGYFRPNPRFGAFPKVSLAVVMGYFVGKLSYQQACAEKLMALPGSYIGQLLRDRRDGKIGGRTSMGSSQGTPSTMLGANPNDIYSDAGPGSSLDLDTDRPLFSSDDTFRTDNSPTIAPQDAQPTRPALSYDELRRKNRNEYTDTKRDPYRVDPSLAPIVTRPRPQPPQTPSTNKYGDLIE